MCGMYSVTGSTDKKQIRVQQCTEIVCGNNQHYFCSDLSMCQHVCASVTSDWFDSVRHFTALTDPHSPQPWPFVMLQKATFLYWGSQMKGLISINLTKALFIWNLNIYSLSKRVFCHDKRTEKQKSSESWERAVRQTGKTNEDPLG